MFSFCFDLLTDLDEYPHLTDSETYTSSWAQELGDNDSETSPAEDQEEHATGKSFWSKIINRFMKIVGGDLSANKNVNVDYGYEDDSYENEEEEEDDGTVDEDVENEEEDEYGGVDDEHGENLEEEYNEEVDNYENYHENEEYEEQEEEEEDDHGIENEEEYYEEEDNYENYHENEEYEEHEEEEEDDRGIENEEEYNEEEDNYNENYHENEEYEEHEEEDDHGIENEEEYNEEEDNYNENYHENEEYEEQEEEEEDDHGIEDDGSETPDGLIEEDHLKSKEDSDKDDIASDIVTNAVKGRRFEESYYLHHPYTDVSLVSDRIPVPRPKLNNGMADGFQGKRSGAQQGTKDEPGDYGENGRPAVGSEYATDSQTDNAETQPGSWENEFEGSDKEFWMNEAVYTSSHGNTFGIAKDFNSRYEEGSEQSEGVDSGDDDRAEGSNEENVDDELFTNYSGENLESYVLADPRKRESTVHGSRPKRSNGNFINVLNNYVSLNALG